MTSTNGNKKAPAPIHAATASAVGPADEPAPGGYAGSVRPGGPAAVRDLGEVTVVKVSVSEQENNCYLLRSGDDLAVIDAADGLQAILAALSALSPPDSGGAGQSGAAAPGVRLIATTHRHWDHHRALPGLAALATGADIVAGAADAAELPVGGVRPLAHGDTLALGAIRLEVIALRGHTPGSIALLYRDPAGIAHLFTGDSLFPGGPGKTGTPGDFRSLMTDLQERVFDALPDDTWVYPGHGDDTTLGAERPHLAEWRSRGW